MMSYDAFGYAIGASLVIYVFFLILLGLLTYIYPLRDRFALRNVVAWFVASSVIIYTSGKPENGTILLTASVFAAVPICIRYIYVTRKKVAA